MTYRAPPEIRRLDPGAEMYREFANGDVAWHVVVKPPSGIEQDRVYVQEARGRVRLATEKDFERA